ncbi:nucleotidyltransferase family protein [Microbulbifer sediminum]|uniref:nucleotidyltransferase family protein n=1 Tax=Microbulbifer sediminum TaxID=2904250 RepID=UPI001F33D6C3|nr:nucleotidyltransferase family protein [Microbulbifer sediminum]
MHRCVYVLKEDSSFHSAIKALDKGGQGVLVFIDEQGRLLGIITDGDVRRAVLRKENNLRNIINYQPEFMSINSHKSDVISRLRRIHRRHMPLVDGAGKLVTLFSLDEIEFISKKNKVVVMAGGLGSRLGELTRHTPKPMLNVGDRPMLHHLVEMFSEHGFSDFIFCVNYKKEVIKEYFDDGTKFGARIQYVEERDRLGTAGALSLIEKSDLDQDFFVINADVLTSVNFTELRDCHVQSNSKATMCVRKHTVQIPYGVVNSIDNHEISSIEEKPVLEFKVNAGIYMLNPGVLDLLDHHVYLDMPSLFERLKLEKFKTTIFNVDEYWLDIGRKEDLSRANADIQYLPSD